MRVKLVEIKSLKNVVSWHLVCSNPQDKPSFLIQGTPQPGIGTQGNESFGGFSSWSSKKHIVGGYMVGLHLGNSSWGGYSILARFNGLANRFVGCAPCSCYKYDSTSSSAMDGCIYLSDQCTTWITMHLWPEQIIPTAHHPRLSQIIGSLIIKWNICYLQSYQRSLSLPTFNLPLQAYMHISELCTIHPESSILIYHPQCYQIPMSQLQSVITEQSRMLTAE